MSYGGWDTKDEKMFINYLRGRNPELLPLYRTALERRVVWGQIDPAMVFIYLSELMRPRSEVLA